MTGEGLEGVVTLCLLTRHLKEFKEYKEYKEYKEFEEYKEGDTPGRNPERRSAEKIIRQSLQFPNVRWTGSVGFFVCRSVFVSKIWL